MGGMNAYEFSRYKERNTLLNKSEIDLLKSHPNYKDQEPIKGETLVGYTLRCAAHIVSPPQDEGESYDVECVVIKAAILQLQEEIEKRWWLFKNCNL